jgi:hypothetical protein
LKWQREKKELEGLAKELTCMLCRGVSNWTAAIEKIEEFVGRAERLLEQASSSKGAIVLCPRSRESLERLLRFWKQVLEHRVKPDATECCRLDRIAAEVAQASLKGDSDALLFLDPDPDLANLLGFCLMAAVRYASEAKDPALKRLILLCCYCLGDLGRSLPCEIGLDNDFPDEE